MAAMPRTAGAIRKPIGALNRVYFKLIGQLYSVNSEPTYIEFHGGWSVSPKLGARL